MPDSTAAPGSVQAARPTHILAIDLGKYKSVACDYDVATGTHAFTRTEKGSGVVFSVFAWHVAGVETLQPPQRAV